MGAPRHSHGTFASADVTFVCGSIEVYDIRNRTAARAPEVEEVHRRGDDEHQPEDAVAT